MTVQGGASCLPDGHTARMRKLLRRAFLLGFFALGLACLMARRNHSLLGDSLTAGLGVKQEQAYPASDRGEIFARKTAVRRDQRRRERRYDCGRPRRGWTVVAEKSTCCARPRRERRAARIADGANEGQSPGHHRPGESEESDGENCHRRMQIPPNMGGDYGTAFRAIFADLARRERCGAGPFSSKVWVATMI